MALGYKYQCSGLFSAILRYTYGGQEYEIQIPDINKNPAGSLFGPGADTYWAPKVMACCGEYDKELGFLDQPQFALNCIMDAREQACYSAVHGLYKEQNSLPNGGRKDAVIEIIERIESEQGYTDCIAGLGTDFPPIPQNVHGATWSVGMVWTTAGLTDVDLTYGLFLGGVHWPDFDYPNLLETCDSLDDNNLVVFHNPEPPLVYQTDVILEEADGELIGPPYGPSGNIIQSTVGFSSDFNSCIDPLCSHASLSEDSSGNWRIDEMVLYIDGYITLDNGFSIASLDRGYIELSGPAKGRWVDVGGKVTYEIDPGQADFIVGGTAGDHNGFLTAHNSTEIYAEYSTGEWEFSSFDIEYLDSSYGTFTLTVDSAIWLDD